MLFEAWGGGVSTTRRCAACSCKTDVQMRIRVGAIVFDAEEAEQRARLFAHEALRQGVKRVVITDRVTPPGPLAPGWFIEPRPIVPEAVRRHVQALVAPAA